LKNYKYILGIETSCDETSVSVVECSDVGTGLKPVRTFVKSCEISSSIPLHQETKGVVPEVAARAQIEAMIPVLDRALKNANLILEEIDLIAVTQSPGLAGSLLVGISTANTLSASTGTPVVGVPHIWGHMYANVLDNEKEIEFPALVLTVSGGHNELYLWKSHGNFEKLGSTLDDAAGEAFDKCGRLLGLNYPAGPEVEKLSKKGNPKAFNFPRSMLNSKDYNFSFSGLKTAFLYKLQELEKTSSVIPSKEEIPLSANSSELHGIPASAGMTNKEKGITEQTKQDLAASLQEAICETLWKKTKKAIQEFSPKEIHLSGGVSANKHLREIFQTESKKLNIKTLRYPKQLKYCTDNAAMIAAAAAFCNFEEQKVIQK
jgi:N6-L-threonylcarbamoyladenine synthase